MNWFSLPYDNEGIETKTSESIIKQETTIKILKMNNCGVLYEDHVRFLFNLMSKNNEKINKNESVSVTLPGYSMISVSALNLKCDDRFSTYFQRICLFLSRRIHKSGCFSGFPNDNPHIVSVLTAMYAICNIGTEEAYNLIEGDLIYDYLMSMKRKDGVFYSTIGTECDLRSTFAALSIAWMINKITPEITRGVFEYVASCHNYDGGFSPIPGSESHGGYLFCAIGILCILDRLGDFDLNKIIRWITSKQDQFSGGFCGRTNKLVDSCYSWWIGSAAKSISTHLKIPDFWDPDGIDNYTLNCAQVHSGGFRDSPPSNPDPFHTAYALAGMSVCGKNPTFHSYIPAPNEKVDKMKYFFTLF